MLTAIIVDDERAARESLEDIVTEYCKDVEILGYACNAEEGYRMIIERKPALVFLDVEMPGGNGFKMLSMFEHINFQIIFTTAYDHYAIKAIKFSALDYILKPIDPDELCVSIKKAKKIIDDRHTRIDSLLGNLQKEEEEIDHIILLHNGRYHKVSLVDIILLEAEGNYTRFVLKKNNFILTSKNLKYYEDILNKTHFLRVHKSTLINLQQIANYSRHKEEIIMYNGDCVKLSRRKKKVFMERYMLN